MAIFCPEHKLLFVMVPGTGCTSVGAVLRKNFGGRFIPEDHIIENSTKLLGRKHNSIKQLLEFKLISQEELNSCLKFATVRNPFDLLATQYQRSVGTWLESQMQGEKLDAWADSSDVEYRQKLVEQSLKSIKRAREEGFEKWLNRKLNPRFDVRLRMWLKNSLTNRDKLDLRLYPAVDGVDEIIRYENLERDLNAVLQKAGINEQISLPHKNPTAGKKPYQDYYSPETRSLVEKRLAGELAKFGYSFD